jgi:hypothetical protein
LTTKRLSTRLTQPTRLAPNNVASCCMLTVPACKVHQPLPWLLMAMASKSGWHLTGY